MKIKDYALQDLGAPDGICFGCGSKNVHGLRIKSYWDDDNVHIITTHTPDERYTGWPSLVYGGLISCLVDCHSNWTAIANHYRMGIQLTLKARVEGEVERKTRVLCEVYAGDTLTVLGDSVFVRVDASHLAKTAHS